MKLPTFQRQEFSKTLFYMPNFVLISTYLFFHHKQIFKISFKGIKNVYKFQNINENIFIFSFLVILLHSLNVLFSPLIQHQTSL